MACLEYLRTKDPGFDGGGVGVGGRPTRHGYPSLFVTARP
jgi:hypothetical protein